MEPQKTQNCQNNHNEKEHSWRNNPPRFQTILQSYRNTTRMVLTQKQTHRSLRHDK